MTQFFNLCLDTGGYERHEMPPKHGRHASDPSIWEAEVEGLQVPDQLGLQGESQASLGYIEGSVVFFSLFPSLGLFKCPFT